MKEVSVKKGVKQVISLLLCMFVSAGILAGCRTKDDVNETETGTGKDTTTIAGSGESTEIEEAKIDISEHVDLKMYLLGDKSPDFDEVYSKINEILEEKLNCSLSVEFLSWAEHGTKYSLLFSAQEDFDLIFTATSWGHYEETVALGGFKPLSEEFVKTYAPDIWNVVPELAWSQAKVKGEAYMVPQYFFEFAGNAMAVRGDLLEKYGVSNITDINSYKEFALKAAADGMYMSQGGPFWEYFANEGLSTVSGAPLNGQMVLFNTQNPANLDFNYILDQEWFVEYCKLAKELADAGCWSPDILNSSDDRQTGLLTGRTASMIWNLGTCKTYAKQANEENPDWNVTLTDPNAGIQKKITPYINAGVAINATSKNAERAMMVLNEFYTNPEVFDLTHLGIEGKHWEAVGDYEYKVIDETNYGVGGNCMWGWRNLDLLRKEYIVEKTPLDIVYDEILEDWNENIKLEHVYDGFSFDATDVTSQMAAIEASAAKYFDPLVNGLVDDVETSIEDFKKAMEDAGIRDVLEEMEKQAAELVASKAGN